MGLDKYFSRRHGHKARKVEFQLQSMDGELRTAIWNVLCLTFWPDRERGEWIRNDTTLGNLLRSLWIFYFRQPIDEYDNVWHFWEDYLKRFIYSCEWHEVYDLLEFVLDHWPDNYELQDKFIPIINGALQLELSGYRIVGRQITPITDETELAAIGQALEVADRISPVTIQLGDALRKLSDRHDPDYRGSIKESISAVETLCRLIADEPKLELGKALGALERAGNVTIHGALRGAFSKLYGWTSDDQGIRHALMEEPNLTFEDAKFMLVACSAFINYLLAKAAQAGIQL
jgi:hypothetical protein